MEAGGGPLLVWEVALAVQKIVEWAKGHKVAAGFLGCGGLIVVGFVLLIVFGLILNAAGYEVEEEPVAEPTSQAPVETTAPAPEPTTAAPEPTPEPSTEAPELEPTTEEPEPEPAPEEESLAAEVKQAAYDAAMIESFQDLGSDSPAYAVTEIEDVSAGTIRVHVQLQQSDAEAELTARWFMNMTCDPVPDLDTVVVRDASGVDRNHFMSSMNPPTLCS